MIMTTMLAKHGLTDDGSIRHSEMGSEKKSSGTAAVRPADASNVEEP